MSTFILNSFFLVTFLEPFNTPGGIYDPLFARKERVALVTQLNPDRRFYRAGLEFIAARARYFALNIFGMDILFHEL